jgi:hypothetical protein
MSVFSPNTDRSVWELQSILRTLGAPLTIDKKYGPITERTWSLLSSRLGLDPYIAQKTPLIATVSKTTHAKLLNEYLLRKSPRAAGANDFERLNNTLVVMERVLGSKNEAAMRLAADWEPIATSPAWRSFVSALPPVWAHSLQIHWDRYLDLWSKLDTNTKEKLVHPASVEPGGVFSLNQWRELWDTASDEALRQGKTLLQNAGKQLAAGAAEETRKQTYEWAYSLAGVALGALGVYYLVRRS